MDQRRKPFEFELTITTKVDGREKNTVSVRPDNLAALGVIYQAISDTLATFAVDASETMVSPPSELSAGYTKDLG